MGVCGQAGDSCTAFPTPRDPADIGLGRQLADCGRHRQPLFPQNGRSTPCRIVEQLPLFEIAADDSLVPFRQLAGGAELYESEIEQLLWDNLDDFTGEPLFRVARQPTLEAGHRPDVVALDPTGHVIVVEIKRDVDRLQLAQCLEYAGWARTTNLDELAGMYYLGANRFFTDWQDFTDSATPVVVSSPPRLLLAARDFHGRTGAAFDFLAENGLPIGLVAVRMYVDQQGRRFVDVELEEDELGDDDALPTQRPRNSHTLLSGRRVRVTDLMDADLLAPGQELVWDRPRLGQTYRAQVTDNGAIELEDGRVYSSVSKAACEAADIAAYDGWYAWGADGVSLHDLRKQLIDASVSHDA